MGKADKFLGMTKAQFRERLWAMFLGAAKGFTASREEPFTMSVGIEEWLGWVAAVQAEYGDHVCEWVFRVHNLHELESLDGAVERLWTARREAA